MNLRQSNKIVIFISFLGFGLIAMSKILFGGNNIKQHVDCHAVIERLEILEGAPTLTIIEEWFKKPGKIRREVININLGEMKKALLYDGENHYAYYPLSGDKSVYRELFDETPSFYLNNPSFKNLKLLKESDVIIDGAEKVKFGNKTAYLISEETDNVNLNIWLNLDNYHVMGWNKTVYNEDGGVSTKEICKLIDSNIQISESLFKIPKGYKIHEDVTDKQNSFAATQMQDIMSKEEFGRYLMEKYPEVPGVYSYLANILLLKKQLTEAIDLLNKSLELNPQQKGLYISLSEAYSANNDIDNAIKAMSEIMKHSPNDPYISYRLGELYEKSDNLKEALVYYKRGLDLQPDDTIQDGEQVYHIEGLKDTYLEAYNRVRGKVEGKR